MQTLVLLPGMDGTGDLFAPFIEAIKGEFKVQVLSYPTDQALGYEELLTLARAAVPRDEPYVLLGESFSGPIAISLAADAPPQLRGLILCCTFARSPHPTFARFQALLSVVPFRWMPSIALGHALLGRFETRALRDAIARAVNRVSPAVLRARLRSVLMVDVSARLAEVNVPCLYLQASQDRVVPARAGAHVKEVLPSTTFVQLNAPHCLLQAAPVEASVAVSDFLREVQLAPRNFARTASHQ